MLLSYFEPIVSRVSWSSSLTSNLSKSLLFLVVGFSDGSILHARCIDYSSTDQINSNQHSIEPFTDIKILNVGSTPTSLHAIGWSDETVEGVAVCCDHPVVVFLNGSSQRLQTTALGINSPNCISRLDTSARNGEGPTLIAWSGEQGVCRIGTIETIQRLQIKTLPLGMSVER